MFFFNALNLDVITKKLIQTFGSHLKMLVHYEEFLASPKHQVLLLVLTQDALLLSEKLSYLNHPYVDFKIFLEKELSQSTDVFPLEFLEIKKKYRLLHGQDLFQSMVLNEGYIRLQSEFYFRSTLLKVRKMMVLSRSKVSVIDQTWPIFLKILEYLTNSDHPLGILSEKTGIALSDFFSKKDPALYLQGLSIILDEIDASSQKTI